MKKYKIPEIAKGKIIPNKKPFFAHPHPATEHLTIEHPPEVIEMVFKKIIEENPTQLDFEVYTTWKNNLKK